MHLERCSGILLESARKKGSGNKGFSPRTLEVLQRKFDNVLGVYVDDSGELRCRNRAFSSTAGLTTTKGIVNALERGKKVIIDTSRLSDEAELLLGSVMTSEIFHRYQVYK